MVYFIMVLILLFISLNVFCESQDNIYMGQKDFGQYYDAFDPDISSVSPLNNLELQTDRKNHSYLESFISRELLFEKIGVFKDIMKSSICSNSDLSKAKDYFRYSHRLLALSYLYEALSDYDYTQKKMGFKNTCRTDLKRAILKCSPPSKDMENFITNLKIFNEYEKNQYVDANESVEKFKDQFKSGFNKKSDINLLHHRLKRAPKNLKREIINICKADAKFFVSICNEQDSLYGMSEIYESYGLLIRSNVFNYLTDRINIAGCLKRYKKEMVYLEKKYSNLRNIFPYLYQEKSNSSNEAGAIFKLGTLREFTDKGLSLYQKKETSTKVKKTKKAERDTFKQKKITKKEIKLMAKKQEPKDIPVDQKEVVVLVKSEFLKTKEFIRFNGLEFKVLNMLDFKYDYLITLKLKNELDSKLSHFLLRKNLEFMKKNDGLGDKDAPIPLIFIKYMIDYNKHKELFSLVDIVGDRFYIRNDIDKDDKSPVSQIRIQNDFQTSFKWEITVY